MFQLIDDAVKVTFAKNVQSRTLLKPCNLQKVGYLGEGWGK